MSLDRNCRDRRECRSGKAGHARRSTRRLGFQKSVIGIIRRGRCIRDESTRPRSIRSAWRVVRYRYEGERKRRERERKRGEEGKLEANVRLLIDGTVASKGTHSREQSGRGGPRNQRGRYSRRNYFRKGIARRDLSFAASRAIGWQSTTRFSYPAIRATEIIIQPYFHAIAWIAWSALG